MVRISHMHSCLHLHGIAWKPLWGDWFKANILLLIDLLVLIISGFVVVGLLGFHTFLMLRGMTTWEAASRERITYLRYLDEDYNPFNEGLCKNIYYFLCSCRTRKWEVRKRASAKQKQTTLDTFFGDM
ncbi:palmitoyltransferase ZDHHC12-A-like [Littorina saxatilis]|uniref:palmitoyltransferase ZDHHC12-A-like n=1 Tax=Littorina saxatilis TaxID=31220 RepID=UPI0038B509BA